MENIRSIPTASGHYAPLYTDPRATSIRAGGKRRKGRTQPVPNSMIRVRPFSEGPLFGNSRGRCTIRGESSDRPNKPNHRGSRPVDRTKPTTKPGEARPPAPNEAKPSAATERLATSADRHRAAIAPNEANGPGRGQESSRETKPFQREGRKRRTKPRPAGHQGERGCMQERAGIKRSRRAYCSTISGLGYAERFTPCDSELIPVASDRWGAVPPNLP